MEFFHLCQRIEEPITEKLMHGASAIEEDEFYQLELGMWFLPARSRWRPKRVQRFRSRIGAFDRILSQY